MAMKLSRYVLRKLEEKDCKQERPKYIVILPSLDSPGFSAFRFSAQY